MRQRLDVMMALRGLTRSRARARDLIKRGEVCVDGAVVTKAGMLVLEDCDLTISAGVNRYVARSGEKLAAAFEHFELPIRERVALDIGASTGGFTQVLLEKGAQHVFAVDVGCDQLHQDLKEDPRVTDMSGVDARNLRANDFSQTFTALSADVSFISLRKVLPAAISLAGAGCWMVVLVKPQFELTPDALGKGGIVKNEADRALAVDLVNGFLKDAGWKVQGCLASPIPGKKGNLEYLVCATLGSGQGLNE